MAFEKTGLIKLRTKRFCEKLDGTLCSIAGVKCYRLNNEKKCDYYKYWEYLEQIPEETPKLARSLCMNLMRPFQKNLRIHLQQKGQSNTKRIIASPLEENLRLFLKKELNPLHVSVSSTGKAIKVWNEVSIIADGLAEKEASGIRSFPKSIFSFKTWIGPEQIRETFAYSYLAKTWLGQRNIRIYEVGIYCPGRDSHKIEELVQACKPYLDGVFYLTKAPYIDELVDELIKIYRD